jgi:hypothetical protein
VVEKVPTAATLSGPEGAGGAVVAGDAFTRRVEVVGAALPPPRESSTASSTPARSSAPTVISAQEYECRPVAAETSHSAPA